MRLIGKMMKGKEVYRFLVPIFVTSIVMSPLNAIEKVGASRAVTADEIER